MPDIIGEKQLSGQIRERIKQCIQLENLKTSEHLCLENSLALLTALFQTLACLFNSISNFVGQINNLIEMTGPEEARKQLWIIFTESNVSLNIKKLTLPRNI